MVNPKGASERLSLVKIYQLDIKQVERFKQSIDASGKQMSIDLKSAISKVDLNELDKQLQLIDAATEKTKSVMRQCVAQRGHMALCLDLIRGLAETDVETAGAIRKKMAQIAVSLKDIEATPSTQIAFIAREAESFAGKNNITPTKTNSEGKYLIQLSSKDNRLLAVPDSEQVRSHAIWLVDGSQTEKTLILSNDNQVGKNCKECVALGVSNETEKVIKQTEELVNCFRSLTEYSTYSCKEKEFVDLIRKLKTI